MRMTLRTSKANHGNRKGKRPLRRKLWRKNQSRTSFAKLINLYMERQKPTDQTIMLRLTNILGLTLIILLLAILGSDGNRRDLVNLVQELFHLLP